MADRTCAVEGCDAATRSREWCNLHYQRWYKTGDPLAIRPARWDGYEKPRCTVADCDLVVHARGLCTIHAPRRRRHGNPTAGRRRQAIGTPEERFLSFVLKHADGCWLWSGSCTLGGYGQFSLRPSQGYAHRWAYEHWVGSTSSELHLDHLCRVRHCVNPEHLEEVTPSENSFRGALARRVERAGGFWSIALLRSLLASIDEAVHAA